MPRTGTSASAHFMSVLGRSVPLVLALSRTLPVKLARAGRIFLHLALFQYFPPSSSPFAPCQWSKHHTPPSPPAKTRPGFLWHPSPPFFPPTLFPRSLPTFPFPSSHIACAPSLRHHNTASLSAAIAIASAASGVQEDVGSPDNSHSEPPPLFIFSFRCMQGKPAAGTQFLPLREPRIFPTSRSRLSPPRQAHA